MPNLNNLPKYAGCYLVFISSCVTNDRVESNAQASCLSKCYHISLLHSVFSPFGNMIGHVHMEPYGP